MATIKGNILLYKLEAEQSRLLKNYFSRKRYNVILSHNKRQVTSFMKNYCFLYAFIDSNSSNDKIEELMKGFDGLINIVTIKGKLQTKNLLKSLQQEFDNNQTKQNFYQLGHYDYSVDEAMLRYSTADNTLMQGLTRKENAILNILCSNMGNIVFKHRIVMSIWRKDDFASARSLDVYISRLRKYLSLDSRVQIITFHARGLSIVVNH